MPGSKSIPLTEARLDTGKRPAISSRSFHQTNIANRSNAMNLSNAVAALAFISSATLLRVEAQAQLIPMLRTNDPILAVDFDTVSNSSYPSQEGPLNALDGNTATKYLNFAGRNSGFIVTPFAGPTVIRSFVITTANDFPERDPASWELYGTSQFIVSADNSDGQGEAWTLIASGPLSLPTNRFTSGPIVSFVNSTVYTSYRLVFPTLRAGPLMQIADVAFFLSFDGSGGTVLTPVDDIRAIHLPSPQSRYPLNENPRNALDGNPATKYLNFGKERSGFIVTPSAGRVTVKAFQFTTANDFADRDPAAWQLYGTDAPIQSTDNSTGGAEPWTLIEEGFVSQPIARFTAGPVVPLTNNAAYASYRMIITTLRNTFGPMVDSVQYSEVQFFTDRPSISIRLQNGNVVIDYSGVLQGASDPAGTYTDVPSATSPYTAGSGGVVGPQYFRARF